MWIEIDMDIILFKIKIYVIIFNIYIRLIELITTLSADAIWLDHEHLFLPYHDLPSPSL